MRFRLVISICLFITAAALIITVIINSISANSLFARAAGHSAVDDNVRFEPGTAVLYVVNGWNHYGHNIQVLQNDDPGAFTVADLTICPNSVVPQNSNYGFVRPTLDNKSIWFETWNFYGTTTIKYKACDPNGNQSN